MGRKAILLVKDGQIIKRTLAKPQAPRTLGLWFRVSDSEAAAHRSHVFAFWAQGSWWVFATGRSEPLRRFDGKKVSQDAVEVYMLTREAHHG